MSLSLRVNSEPLRNRAKKVNLWCSKKDEQPLNLHQMQGGPISYSVLMTTPLILLSQHTPVSLSLYRLSHTAPGSFHRGFWWNSCHVTCWPFNLSYSLLSQFWRNKVDSRWVLCADWYCIYSMFHPSGTLQRLSTKPHKQWWNGSISKGCFILEDSEVQRKGVTGLRPHRKPAAEPRIDCRSAHSH